MRNLILIIVVSLFANSCFFSDYEGDLIESPSSNYMIKAKVNRTDNKSVDYADVVIEIYNSDNSKIKELNTKAGDANKWAIGWTNHGDTIVLQSSDIGNRAWSITNDTLSEIEVSSLIDMRASELKAQKYSMHED